MILLADTETTGTAEEDEICEIAFLEVDVDLNILSEFQSLVKPTIPIKPQASAASHITDRMVEDSPTIAEALESCPIDFSEPLSLVAHNCVTGDHEVLTPEGWIRFDLLPNDKDVMQWDPHTGRLSFTPCSVLRKPYKGEVLCWDSAYHKGIYTPNHRIIFKGNQGKDEFWREEVAEDFAHRGPNSAVIPVSGVYESETLLDVTPNEARIIEMIRADGNIQKSAHSYSARFKFKKQSKVTRCRALLEEEGLGYNHCVRDGVDCIRTYAHARLNHLCSLLGVGKTKQYGPWVLRLSIAARLALLAELPHWDGSRQLDGGKGQVLVHSAKVQDVLWLREMAVLTGFCSTVRLDKPNNRGFSQKDGVIHCVTVRPRDKVKTLYKPEVADFDGTVYCVTVPTGAFLIRREGATWVTGNSQFDRRFLKPYWNIESDLCSLKAARIFYPDAPDHKLQTLRYYLDLDIDVAAHRAMADVLITRGLLSRICLDFKLNLQDIFEEVSRPREVTTMPFGKHKGTLIKELPRNYVAWVLQNVPNLEPPLREALEKRMK